ncbi:glycosyltransferase, partial [bacterium]|nr:glycosyltransferase [bacterium]
MVKVSVIIPVYNTEKYIEKCVNSIISQTLSEIEIILVNDGSTDSSLKIINRYKEIDSRVRVINQTNAGAGAARNAGMKEARGEYLLFLDA